VERAILLSKISFFEPRLAARSAAYGVPSCYARYQRSSSDQLRRTDFSQRSSGRSPVCLAILASIFGPISS
jgi:hypothetical protein